MQAFTRFRKGIDLWVLELSLPTRARSIFYIPVAWFGLLLIFFSDGAMMILAMNLRTPPKKKRVLFGHFPPSTVVTALLAENRPENILSLDLVGWKGSVCGDLDTSLFTTKSQLSEGKSCFLPPPALRFLS